MQFEKPCPEPKVFHPGSVSGFQEGSIVMMVMMMVMEMMMVMVVVVVMVMMIIVDMKIDYRGIV